MRLFQEYYYGFLGIDNEEKTLVVESKYRDEPLNEKYFYPVIVAEYKGKRICSASSKYLQICIELFDGTEKSIQEILKSLNKENNYRLRKMRRYSFDGIKDKLETSAIPLTEDIINLLEFSNEFNKEKFIRRKKQIIKEGRQFIKVHEKKMGAMALISDIYENGGNIAVFTNQEYRNLGYGKEVVSGCINWCEEEGILPIYLVEEGNAPSIKLAESLGFKFKSEEWIISE